MDVIRCFADRPFNRRIGLGGVDQQLDPVACGGWKDPLGHVLGQPLDRQQIPVDFGTVRQVFSQRRHAVGHVQRGQPPQPTSSLQMIASHRPPQKQPQIRQREQRQRPTQRRKRRPAALQQHRGNTEQRQQIRQREQRPPPVAAPVELGDEEFEGLHRDLLFKSSFPRLEDRHIDPKFFGTEGQEDRKGRKMAVTIVSSSLIMWEVNVSLTLGSRSPCSRPVCAEASRGPWTSSSPSRNRGCAPLGSCPSRCAPATHRRRQPPW